MLSELPFQGGYWYLGNDIVKITEKFLCDNFEIDL